MVVETWLNSKITDSVVKLDGYNIFRHDREGQVGGGVCVLIKENVNGQKVYASVNTTYQIPYPIQSLWINVKVGGAKFLISSIYRPSYSTEETDLMMIAAITKACEEKMPVYIMGDFNYRQIDWKNLSLYMPDRQNQLFLEKYLEMNAYQMISFLTRFRNDQASLLDLLLVNDKKSVYELHGEPALGASDHIVIVGKTQIKCASRLTRKVVKRNFWKADYDNINKFLANHLYVLPGPRTDTFSHCMDMFSEAINKFVPLIYAKTNSRKPWLNYKIFNEICKKRKLWDKYIRLRSAENYRIYRLQNNVLKRMIKDARKKYEEEIASSKSNKRFFKFVSRVLNSKVSSITLKDEVNGDIIDNDAEVAEKFAEHFYKMFTVENNTEVLPKLPSSTRCSSEITDILFTKEKVFEALKNIKTHSSPGPDEITTIFLQKCSETISPLLAIIMNNFLKEGELPELWKLSIVTPLYKKGNRNLAENYRPISLTCNLCKCMEKIIVMELTSFLLDNQIISKCQHGFLPGRSTLTNMVLCLDDWTKNFDNNIQTDVIYLDFEKAFDRVPHNRLLYKLEHYGVRGHLLKFISSFLKDRFYQVRVNGSMSARYKVQSGVPQGSVLGPLLFLTYICDLAENIQSAIVFFADDTKLYSTPNSHYDVLSEDLRSIELWCNTWKMKLNEDKCTVLSIGVNNTEFPYLLNGTPLHHVNNQTDLGIIVTSNLKWEAHISKIVKKANSFVYCMQRAFEDRSVNLVLKLYKTFIRPKLEYAQAIWSPYFVKDIEMLERSQRKVTKIPHEVANNDYVTRLAKLHLTTLRVRRMRGDLIETFKILHQYYKCSLDIFHPSQNAYLRGHTKKLAKERSAKLPRKNFLINRSVYLWNALSEDTVSASSVDAFKNKIDKELNDLLSVEIHYGQ